MNGRRMTWGFAAILGCYDAGEPAYELDVTLYQGRIAFVTHFHDSTMLTM